MRLCRVALLIGCVIVVSGCGKSEDSLAGKWRAYAAKNVNRADTTGRAAEFTDDQFIIHVSDASEWQDWKIEGDRFITGHGDTLWVAKRSKIQLVLVGPDTVTYTFNRVQD
jgi:hypothetical protein